MIYAGSFFYKHSDIFIAPNLLGEKRSIIPIDGKGFDLMAQSDESDELENISIERFEDDICITEYPRK